MQLSSTPGAPTNGAPAGARPPTGPQEPTVAELMAIIEKQREDINTVAWLLEGLLRQVRQAQAKALMQQLGPAIEKAIEQQLSNGGQIDPNLRAMIAKKLSGQA